MRTLPSLMKSMNDNVRPSDALIEDTKQKMKAAIQPKEAPVKKQSVFRYSTVLAGLAIVVVGATIVPRFTENMYIPDSGYGTSSGNTGSDFSSSDKPSEEVPLNPIGPNGARPKPDSSGFNKHEPPNAVVQPPLYPALPPESSQDADSDFSGESGSWDSKSRYPILFYSKRLPTLSEINLARDHAGSASNDDHSSSVPPGSPIDAPVQSPGVEPPSGAVKPSGPSGEAPDTNGISGNPDESSVPTLDELIGGSTTPVVKVGENKLYFQPVSSITVSSWSLPDPESVEEKQWGTEEIITYFGRDPREFALPQGLNLVPFSGPISVWFDQEGKPYYDSVGFEFSNGSRTVTITMSKIGIPTSRSIFISNREGSVLNGASLQIGYQSVNGQNDTYTAEFVFGGIGYQIISDNLSQREFITLIQSITS